MIFAIPVTETLSETNFNTTKSIFKFLLKRSDIDSGLSRMGFFVYDETVRESSILNLADFSTKAAMMDAVDKVPYVPSKNPVMIKTALSQLLEMFNSTRGDRLDATNLVYLASDFSVNYTDATLLSRQLKDQGTYLLILTVQYNATDESTLFELTDGRVLVRDSYSRLENIVGSMYFNKPECSKYMISFCLIFQRKVNVATYYQLMSTNHSDL